jgi:hypothetical protein
VIEDGFSELVAIEISQLDQGKGILCCGTARTHNVFDRTKLT